MIVHPAVDVKAEFKRVSHNDRWEDRALVMKENLSLLGSILDLAHLLAESVFSLLSTWMKLVVSTFPGSDFLRQKCARFIARQG